MEIPYKDAGSIKSMFPDILVVRKGADGYLFDILEPHDPSLKDNASKAVGLAEFAEKHYEMFDRIELIRKQKGSNGVEQYFRLDMSDSEARKKVLGVKDNGHLDQILKEHSIPRKSQ